jgi:hypothetical protein
LKIEIVSFRFALDSPIGWTRVSRGQTVTLASNRDISVALDAHVKGDAPFLREIAEA